MQTDHNPNGGRGASLSRRKLFQIAAAGTAAAMPVLTEAAVAEDSSRLPQLTDEQQLDECIEQLKSILKRMHPIAEESAAGYTTHEGGGGGVLVSVYRRSCGWSGPGFYEVFDAGTVRTYWVDRHFSKAESRFELWGAIPWDGHLTSPRALVRERDLMRKLEGGAA
ncbi:hypothetical protein [Rhizobium leguminosarum]|uniref:hypothetical protein n=1 Tax=Rhizobium TaxID=379 RepID=UPI00140F853B|nr:hypothetical protein [Rhizobium leguminosarum]QIO67487.1 hypothetical protein HA462_21405 [Rhizobium leguminosarum bv. trifolii]